MGRYLGVLIAALTVDAAVWHLLTAKAGTTMLAGGAAGLVIALGIVRLSGLHRRARYLLAIATVLSALLSLALMAAMPALQPAVAHAFAALAAFGFGFIGFALYLRGR